MPFESRIRQIIDKEDLNLKEFSEKIKISYRTIQNYLHERRTPSADFLLAVHNHLDISIDWLLTGKGQMYYRDKVFDKPPTLLSTATIAKQPTSKQYLDNNRSERLQTFINHWLNNHNGDEQAWFEIEFKRHFTDYANWLAESTKTDKSQAPKG